MYGGLSKVCPCYLSVGVLSLVVMKSTHCGGASITGLVKATPTVPRLGEVSRGIRDNNDVPVITKDLVNGLFLSKGYMSGSVTRLERYQQCPFKFYAQYGLKLEPRRVRSFGAPEIGTFFMLI